MWIVCITSVRHVLTVNGYGGRQTKENEKSWCFKGWETLVYNINGTLESYSPILNTDFTVLNLGTYSIQIQGDGWYAEGEVEIE